MIRISLATIVALVTLSASAAAQEAAQDVSQDTPHPVLRAEAVVTSDIVRIGDLIDNAGIIAKVPIFRAPDLGFTGTVSADDVATAVRAHALYGLDTNGLSEVKVTRAARSIPAKDIEALVAQALSQQYDLGSTKDITITFDREVRSMFVDPTAKGDPRVAQIDYNARRGTFDATLDLPVGTTSRGTLHITGRALATVDVVTIARAVERGTVIKESDVMIDRRPRTELTRDTITDRKQAIGLAARTALQAGHLLHTAELMKPEVVQRNDYVMLAFEVPGIKLTVRGKAVEGGAEGDTIAVLNEQTKRTIQGVIVAPGHVVVPSAGPRLAANFQPTQGSATYDAAPR
jgi:flagella basal body P-ring formation protein FlgA